MASLRSSARADVAVALGLLTYGLVEAAVQSASPAWYPCVFAMSLPLAVRRRWPWQVVVWSIFMVIVPGGAFDLNDESVLPLPLFVISGYTIGRESATWRRAIAGALAVVATLSAAFWAFDETGENTAAEDVVGLAVIMGGSTGAGQLLRIRRRENQQLQSLSAQLAAERDERARVAVVEERSRVARELHDIVAHSVSLIAVQAAAADELLGRDEARTRASLRAVQDTARGAMTDMRRLLSVLRAGDEDPGLAPQPGLEDVAELVDQARGAGLPVGLREEGERRGIPPGVDLSAYRIIQEALTNVRRHAAGARTDVLLRYEPEEVVVEVSNADGGGETASENDRGHGIAGMRERARLYGGTLEVDRGGGWFVVQARLPLEGTASAEGPTE